MVQIDNLNSGEIIPVYRCPAACRHCLYGCSNKMNGQYISHDQCESLCLSLKNLGCTSAHIGGGEPFLNFESLLDLVHTMNKYNIQVEYIETNAAWCVDSFDDIKIIDMLKQLMSAGANCILISIDPFHVEYVPLKKPLRLIKLCQRAGIDYFVWQQHFIKTLFALDIDKTYSYEELKDLLGKDYVYKTAEQYGLTYNGRALNIAREYKSKKPLEELLNSAPCRELLNVNHYHADLNGYFIPPGCTGIGVELCDLRSGLTLEKYPVFNLLASGGIAEFYEYAKQFGFLVSKDGYVSKCDFCYDCRKFLLKFNPSTDIYPADYYHSDF